MQNYWAIIPAAGIGNRMNSSVPKQYLTVLDRTILEHTLLSLLSCSIFKKIIVVISPDDPYWSAVEKSLNNSKIITATGGQERFHSVYQGLLSISEQAQSEDWVLVHDAVRPCILKADINRLIDELADHPVGGLFGIPVADTLKRINADGHVISTIPRSNVWRAQTPQLFRYSLLRHAIDQSIVEHKDITDEAAAIEELGMQPLMVKGNPDNIKLTFPEDLHHIEWWLSNNRELEA